MTLAVKVALNPNTTNQQKIAFVELNLNLTTFSDSEDQEQYFTKYAVSSWIYFVHVFARRIFPLEEHWLQER